MLKMRDLGFKVVEALGEFIVHAGSVVSSRRWFQGPNTLGASRRGVRGSRP
jgi:hypothetical protein